MMKSLRQTIEELRGQLVRIAAAKGFQDEEVLRLSQKLDVLIVNYLKQERRKAELFYAEAI
jgi:hypothetical protein